MTENASEMKTPVADSAVDEYVSRIRAGGPLGQVFPGKLSDCDFIPIQREKFRKVRVEKRALLKNGKAIVAVLQLQPNSRLSLSSVLMVPKVLIKFRKMLYF